MNRTQQEFGRFPPKQLADIQCFKNVECQTLPQLVILNWLDRNFYEEGIVSVELQSETQIKITDRNNDTATIVWQPNGIEFDGKMYEW